MKSEKLTIDIFMKHPGFPVAAVPFSFREPGEPNYTFIPHYHDFQELVIIVSGSGIQLINGTRCAVSAGDVFLLQGQDEHCFTEASPSLRLCNILYDADRLPLPQEYFRKLRNYNLIFRVEPALRRGGRFPSFTHLDGGELDELEKLITQLSRILDAGAEGFEAEGVVLLSRMILLLSRDRAAQKGIHGTMIDGINQVISMMEKNFTRRYTVAELARHIHTSPRNFSRLFHRVTSCGPIEYLLKIRLRHGAALLSDTAGSCADIAAETGFADSNYFSRKFSEQYGLSPREYRKYYRGKR